ncbi:hypothetical protein ACJMK2_020458 [Sinanodonta woodiana]|uniref:Nitric oxide synthase-interacting protein zinc-finger domain-containing protein n=1 Tax=Sinanodonta woodiana TaxID=1069815 RepID=A0ABD3U052_SINWO
MTRHSRNNTAGTVYSYHEKKKDHAASGYGSKYVRFGKDSVKEFDCCCLTLQPCKNPVITPDGYLYDKEAILNYILHQKKEIARKLKEYEKQQHKWEAEAAELKKAEDESNVRQFSISQAPSSKKDEKLTGSRLETGGSISNMKDGHNKKLPSFWLPCLTPDAAPTKLEKPDERVRCPMSGKPLKLKDLIDIKFTPIKDGDSKTSLIAKQARFVCAVTNDVLNNSVQCAVLRPSGAVVTMECVEKLVKLDMMDPICGAKLTDKDIIPLQRGASGFAGAGVNLEAKKEGPALQA